MKNNTFNRKISALSGLRERDPEMRLKYVIDIITV